jgi:hypothetical protein
MINIVQDYISTRKQQKMLEEAAKAHQEASKQREVELQNSPEYQIQETKAEIKKKKDELVKCQIEIEGWTIVTRLVNTITELYFAKNQLTKEDIAKLSKFETQLSKLIEKL